MVMSRDQNAGRNHIVRIDNSTFEKVEEFKYFGTTLTNQNSILEEIKGRLRSGNACYHLVQDLLSSRLLSKNLKIKIQGDSGGICTTLGNDSMSDSKQKSPYEHGSDFERLRSYDRLKLRIEGNDY